MLVLCNMFAPVQNAIHLRSHIFRTRCARRHLACELDGPGTGRLELPDDLRLGLDGDVVDRDHLAADGQPRSLPTNSRACSGGGQDGDEAQSSGELLQRRFAPLQRRPERCSR